MDTVWIVLICIAAGLVALCLLVWILRCLKCLVCKSSTVTNAMEIGWILLIVFGCICIAVLVIAIIYWRFCNGCRSRDRTLSMASNRPERIYSIYTPETIKRDGKEETDNNNHLGLPETRGRRTVTISEQVEVREYRVDTGENSRPQSSLHAEQKDS
ncbi:hypothetical protein PFISCL1PPCAC_20556, partial [Pristionchus fissidentatus]